MVSTTLFASSTPPSPPCSHTLESANSQPLSSQKFLTNEISASVSVTNWFRVTTHGTSYFAIFSICFSKLTIPRFKASRSSVPRFSLATPPLYFNARTVATKTTVSGRNPPMRHLISKNFSAPRSAPNPASVMI